MPRNIVFAIDPGLLTGLVLVDIKDRMNPVKIWSKEADTEEFYKISENTIEKTKENLIVVVENFIISERTYKLTQAPWSLMYRGFIEYLCWKHNVPCILQTPSEAKDFVTNEKLKLANMWHVGGAGHANDAARHFVKYHSDRSPRWTKTLMV